MFLTDTVRSSPLSWAVSMLSVDVYKRQTKYSRKFLAEHEADLELYRAAQAEMRSLLGLSLIHI